VKIGLLDIDGHNFPNLALMKISAYHKAMMNEVEWVNFFEHYDIVFKSKVFTFTQDNGFVIDADSVVHGGTGYNDDYELPEYVDKTQPDYSIYPNIKHAYGFLTRGCPNKCSWCVVPRKEGNIRPYDDIDDILQNRKSAILMDNNVLASDWGIKQIEKIIKLRVKVDFNQGLDARLIDEPMAKLLSKVRWLSPLRMSCDTDAMINKVVEATKRLRNNKCTPSNYFVYVLVTDIPSALKRVAILDSMKLDPFAQPFIDFSGKNNVTKEQRRFARWVNHKAIFRSVKWGDYND
jgi:hypothetical protein